MAATYVVVISTLRRPIRLNCNYLNGRVALWQYHKQSTAQSMFGPSAKKQSCEWLSKTTNKCHLISMLAKSQKNNFQRSKLSKNRLKALGQFSTLRRQIPHAVWLILNFKFYQNMYIYKAFIPSFNALLYILSRNKNCLDRNCLGWGSSFVNFNRRGRHMFGPSMRKWPVPQGFSTCCSLHTCN